MADVYIDREANGAITVTVCSGMSEPKKRTFADRAMAEQFANSKLGKRSGMILSTLDMTPEQLAARRARVV